VRAKSVRAAIIAGLGMLTLAYGSLEKQVLVRIDGRAVRVRTFAGSVGDALERAGVRVEPGDRVIPPPPDALRDGATIEVRRAKPITLLLDGHPRHVIVTGLTVEEVLEEIALRGSLADAVRPSRAARVRAGMTLSYRRAVLVTVLHDGKTERVITNAPTAGEVVSELGISLGQRDRIEPGPATAPGRGTRIRVVRVGLRTEIDEVVVPFRTIVRRDRTLEYGLRRVASVGRSGVRRDRYLSKYVDGRRVGRRVLGTKTIRAARAHVIAIGTAFPGCPCSRGSALGRATWYYQADGLSAAHRTLRLGTVVRVENLSNGRWVNVVIRDRGPYGSGRIIDLSDEAFRRLASLGTGVIRVRIRW
jgi:uncharacterized protein YabE (DUF348 family)